MLGWFSRHVYYLDDVDPKYSRDESATGFFPDADGDVMVTDSGLMIVFDGQDRRGYGWCWHVLG